MKRTYINLICLTLLPLTLFAAKNNHLRGERYCEVIVPKSLTEYAVYNTFGLNDCPSQKWENVTPACVKKEMDKSLVHLNGPRYWVIDGIENSKLMDTEVKTICGLSMREAGVLKLSMMDLVHAKTPYRQHRVARHTTWIFEVNKPVYELIDKEGNVYVMQSFSVQDTKQTLASLAQLGSKLHLPEGWQFKTGSLKKTEKLTAIDSMAIVVQDDLANTYQKATHDFLA